MITNGFPKSGNHALVKALQLLGQPCQVNHIKYGEDVGCQHIFIKRDPRNVICSWLRFNGQQVTPGVFLTAFRKFQERSLIEEMADYEGWLSGFVVRYEDLISSDAEMRRIADHLEIPYLEGAFESLPGMTRTWFADHSDYMAIWTADVETVWVAEGGNDLLARWGY
jgi:hypothetical protein